MSAEKNCFAICTSEFVNINQVWKNAWALFPGHIKSAQFADLK
jgi:hypothetical protein